MGGARVVVVGGGIAGSAVALALRERGARVTVVEREAAANGPPATGMAPPRPEGGRPEAPVAGRGGSARASALPTGRATPASAGMLAPQYESSADTPLFRLGVRSRRQWEGFAARLEELADRPVHRAGGGMLIPSFSEADRRASEHAAGWQRAAGLRAELLDRRRAARLQPGLPSAAASFLWLPDEGRVDSQRLAAALPAALAAAGAERLTGRAVSAVRSRSGEATGVSLAGGGELEAERVILAAGAWSARLRGLPRPLPIRPVRGQMLRYRAASGPPRRILAEHGGRYLVPRADGSLLAGSTMEEAGFELRVTRDGIAGIRRAAERLLPSLRGATPVGSWAGLRPMAGDHRPILGPDPGLKGLFYATGYGRNGILLAPAAGRIVARLALTGSAGEEEWKPFRPERFAAQPTPTAQSR